MKLYIAVLDEVPSHMVPVLVAHSVLTAHRAWWPAAEKSKNCYYDWITNSYKKVVVKLNRNEFNKLLEVSGIVGQHESTVLEGTISCLVVHPREEYPNVIKFAKLWQP